MSFQKCPICEGSGRTHDAQVEGVPENFFECPTCRGMRIVSSLTGLPPEKAIPEVSYEKTEKDLVPDAPEYTEEEIRYYASPYFDELQAKKEAHRKDVEERMKDE